MCIWLYVFQICLLLEWQQEARAASDKIPHAHKGLIKPFDGRQISYTITKEESMMLDNGKPVHMTICICHILSFGCYLFLLQQAYTLSF